jgi:tetratricopeptide (TPR) repeat protein
MERRNLLGVAICGAALAVPSVGGAQSTGAQSYAPPKLRKAASTSVPVAGPGTIVIQVLVKADGSFEVQKVLKSTNHADDAAALDVAKHSTYAPARRGSKAIVAFYDFTLKLNAAGGSTADTAPPSGLAAFERQLHAGNYTSAQTGLKAFVAQNPTDMQAQVDLGVADTYVSDYPSAVAAFDKVGTIGDAYKGVAGKAYAEYAQSELSSKSYDKALAAAKRAVELTPTFITVDTLGYAEFMSGDNTSAVADLEKARALGQSTNAKAHDRVQVDDRLISAYLAAGKPDQAKTIAAEVAQLDPSDTSAQSIMAASIATQAGAAQQAGKYAEAAALFEQAATLAPSQAATLYANAAFSYLSVKPTASYDSAKAAADNALKIDANSAAANYAEGVVLADTRKGQEALVYLNKAGQSAKAANNDKLALQIDRAIKELSDQAAAKDGTNVQPKVQY